MSFDLDRGELEQAVREGEVDFLWSAYEDVQKRAHMLLVAIRSERRRWHEIREWAAKREDAELSEAMDAASQRYADRARRAGEGG